jgi:hypothetical protein
LTSISAINANILVLATILSGFNLLIEGFIDEINDQIVGMVQLAN